MRREESPSGRPSGRIYWGRRLVQTSCGRRSNSGRGHDTSRCSDAGDSYFVWLGLAIPGPIAGCRYYGVVLIGASWAAGGQSPRAASKPNAARIDRGEPVRQRQSRGRAEAEAEAPTSLVCVCLRLRLRDDAWRGRFRRCGCGPATKAAATAQPGCPVLNTVEGEKRAAPSVPAAAVISSQAKKGNDGTGHGATAACADRQLRHAFGPGHPCRTFIRYGRPAPWPMT